MFTIQKSLPLIALSLLASVPQLGAAEIRGRVVEVLPDPGQFRVELTEGADEVPWAEGGTASFRVGKGDLEIGYEGREVRGDAHEFGGDWHLSTIFPVDGEGAKAMRDVNEQFHRETAAMSRRKILREGDKVPNFALIDQRGDFVQARSLRDAPFVMNFIFTRCAMPRMCPASSSRMGELLEAAREKGLDDLQFVTISFDPEYDSPGVLREYAKGYGLKGEDVYLLTGDPQVVDDLLRQFGIRTMDEGGTINHSMATFIVDGNGRIAHRKDGSQWSVENFLNEAKKL